jgi:hypothetical protein
MICNQCAKRKCRTEPVHNRSGLGRVFTCRSFQRPTSGFSMLELLMEKDPGSVLHLLWQVRLTVVETKKGFKVRYAKNKTPS